MRSCLQTKKAQYCKKDVTRLFTDNGIIVPTTIIHEDLGMYPHKDDAEFNWSFFTIAAFKELQSNRKNNFRNVAIVGIGSGVEGIAAAHIFKDNIQHLIVSDISEDISQGAQFNISSAINPNSLRLSTLTGSLCEPLRIAGINVDLVFANIPNLPYQNEDIPDSGEERGTYLSPSEIEKGNAPKEFAAWALAGQYAYLQSAKEILNDKGVLVTELGGRVPNAVIEKLFNHCGYQLEEVITGFKVQTEALIDFIGYHEFENKYGVTFDFYRYDECKALLNKKCISNPTSSTSSKDLKDLFSAHKVSAGEAIQLHHKGVSVGHIVQVLLGRPN